MTWNCRVLPDIRKSICLYVSKLRPLVLLLRAVLRMKMSVERWRKIEAFGVKPVPLPIFQHISNTSQRTQSISMRKPSLNAVLGNNRCLFLQSCGTHKCTVWTKLNVKPGGTYTNVWHFVARCYLYVPWNNCYFVDCIKVFYYSKPAVMHKHMFSIWRELLWWFCITQSPPDVFHRGCFLQ